MKRFLLFFAAIIVLASAAACGIESREDNVLSSLGHYEFHHFYTSGGFQDYTDFAVYTYSTAKLTDNPYFVPVTGNDMETLTAFLDDFEGWIDTIRQSDPTNEVVTHYAFDRTIVDSGDWFYLYEGENYPKFGCYDLWIFDSQTNTLYYFHSNI